MEHLPWERARRSARIGDWQTANSSLTSLLPHSVDDLRKPLPIMHVLVSVAKRLDSCEMSNVRRCSSPNSALFRSDGDRASTLRLKFPVSSVLGRLRALTGDLDGGVADCEAGLSLVTTMQTPLLSAESSMVLADVLSLRGLGTDSVPARGLLTDAIGRVRGVRRLRRRRHGPTTARQSTPTLSASSGVFAPCPRSRDPFDVARPGRDRGETHPPTLRSKRRRLPTRVGRRRPWPEPLGTPVAEPGFGPTSSRPPWRLIRGPSGNSRPRYERPIVMNFRRPSVLAIAARAHRADGRWLGSSSGDGDPTGRDRPDDCRLRTSLDGGAGGERRNGLHRAECSPRRSHPLDVGVLRCRRATPSMRGAPVMIADETGLVEFAGDFVDGDPELGTAAAEALDEGKVLVGGVVSGSCFPAGDELLLRPRTRSACCRPTGIRMRA